MAGRVRAPALASDDPSRIAATEIDRARDLGAGFLAHQIGEPARQLAFVGFRKGAEQHVGNDQTEHMIAEKLQALIAAGAIARALERGNMRERAFEQRGVGESIADALFERGGAALSAARLFRNFARCNFDRGSIGNSEFRRRAASWRSLRQVWRSAAATHRTSVNRRSPAHRPRPTPDFPGVGIFADREENDLRPADQISRKARSRPG